MRVIADGFEHVIEDPVKFLKGLYPDKSVVEILDMLNTGVTLVISNELTSNDYASEVLRILNQDLAPLKTKVARMYKDSYHTSLSLNEVREYRETLALLRAAQKRRDLFKIMGKPIPAIPMEYKILYLSFIINSSRMRIGV